MLHKTKGIVFRFTKYGETSIIVTIFTQAFGLQSYMVNGARSNSKRSKIALFQPLTLLDLVVYYKENANILRIKEVKCCHPYQSITQAVSKSAIAMFVNEVLNKAVKEQSHAEEIYDFIFRSLITLDQQQYFANFHLVFLLGLSKYLGFGPNLTEEIIGGHWMDQEEEKLLKKLMLADYETIIPMTYDQRQTLLISLLRFYGNHIDHFGEMKSLPVLREILK
ncbi:MAG: DNA repair protein RecO [Cyclobacteriaceae bacterium]|nr:DNA repair protein RecO [Cyclobacteriaceae bacterium]